MSEHNRFIKRPTGKILVAVGCSQFTDRFHDMIHGCWDMMNEGTDCAAILSSVEAAEGTCNVVMVCAVIEGDKRFHDRVVSDLDRVVRKHFKQDIDDNETIH